MRVVLDTNVFISAVFFGGIPGRVLDLWRDGKLELLMTSEILDEYRDVVSRLAARFPGVDPDPIVSVVVRRAAFVQAAPLKEPVCEDPDDDKFLAAAVAGDSRMVVSGDNHLLTVSGYRGIEVLTPAKFVERLGN